MLVEAAQSRNMDSGPSSALDLLHDLKLPGQPHWASVPCCITREPLVCSLTARVFNLLVSTAGRHKVLGIDMVTVRPSPAICILKAQRGSFLPDGRGGSLTQQMLGKDHSVGPGAHFFLITFLYAQ